MCIVSFCIGNNYRDLTAASLYVRLLQTHLLYRSPPCSLEQRSIQPVWWWRLLFFSHRETYSHHKGSFAGHTHGVLQYWGRTLLSSSLATWQQLFGQDKHWWAFGRYLVHLFFNRQRFRAWRFPNPPTSQSPVRCVQFTSTTFYQKGWDYYKSSLLLNGLSKTSRILNLHFDVPCLYQ